MDNWAHCQGMSVTPRRYLQREWKRNKPHLPPCDSLPTLRLCPKRPLFVCVRCGFANAWIPLCLWCEWTSAEATKQFESNMPRPRRLSAPSKVAPAPRKVKRGPPRRTSANSVTSSTGPVTPQGELSFSSGHSVEGVPGITTVLESFHVRNHGERHLSRKTKGTVNRDAVASADVSSGADVRIEVDDVGGVHGVATATSITPTTSLENTTPEPEIEQYERVSEDLDLTRNSIRHRRRLPALCVSTPHTHIRASYCSSCKVEYTGLDNSLTTQAMNSMTSVLIEASNSPRATDCMYMSSGSQMNSTLSVSSSQCSPTRALRRTKHIRLHKRKSSLSLHSRSRPSSPLRESIDIPAASAVEVRQSHALSFAPSQDNDPPVRLGHPSRPYYSAIRNNMSRPTSPAFSMSAPRTPSPISSYAPRETKSLDGGDRSCVHYAQELRPMSMVLPGQVMSAGSRSGFSLSGETELRMSLARWRRDNAPDEPGDYHFREMGQSRTKVDMKGKVKKLGKGLKNLVLGKS
ncbi:hypothetical protein BS17DRAFT_754336 [Gyrodon lividus]|nr:hypothetical protein BS17DRAFT_754336 [Gyrodon lividus]